MEESVELVLRGLGTTLELVLGGSVLAVVCAVAAGLGRLSRDDILRLLSGTYIEVFRGTSALVQLFWIYYALPILLGIDIEAMVAGILVLGLNVGAYGAEVVRGAVQDVPRTQREAALALGLSRRQSLRHVILPQAIPAMLPPAGNLLIELVKVSALVSLITLADLTYATTRIREHTLETGLAYGVALVLYFLIAGAITLLMRRIEGRFAWRKE